jgi:hypothetical protein
LNLRLKALERQLIQSDLGTELRGTARIGLMVNKVGKTACEILNGGSILSALADEREGVRRIPSEGQKAYYSCMLSRFRDLLPYFLFICFLICLVKLQF